VPASSFSIVAGAEKLKKFSFRHESGTTISLNFCPDCASVLYKEADDESHMGKVVVQAGTLDAGNGSGMVVEDVKVKAELWVGHRVPWVRESEGVAQLEGFPILKH